MIRRPWSKVVALLAGLQAVNACSVLLKEKPEQCSADGDCAKRGFPASRCDTAQRVCVPLHDETTGGDGGASASGGAQTTGGTTSQGGTTVTSGNAGVGGQTDAGSGGAAGAGASPSQGGEGGAGGTPPDCGDSCNEPVGVRLIGATGTTQIGSTITGVDHADICPNDQVLIGIRMFLGTRTNYEFLQRAQAICGVLELDGSEIRVESGVQLRLRGNGFADDVKLERICPENEIVVGLSGYAHPSGTQAVLVRCAPLSADATSSEDSSVTVGDVTDLDWAGPTDSGTEASDADCPEGTVARGVTVRSDPAISRLGITCAAPTLAFPDGAQCTDASACASVRCEHGYCRTAVCDAPEGCVCSIFDTKPFAFCSAAATYYNGGRVCEEAGLQLASVRSDTENGWLRSTASLNGLTATVLLGGNDIGIEGNWVWPDRAGTQFWQGPAAVSGGAPVASRFAAWSSAEPSNVAPDLDCAVSAPDDRWAAKNCDVPSPFACSLDP